MARNSTEGATSINKFKDFLTGIRNKKAGIEQQAGEISETIETLRKSPVSIDDFAVFVRSAVDLRGSEWLRFMQRHTIIGSFMGEEMRLNERGPDTLSGEMLLSSSLFRKIFEGGTTAAICALFPEMVVEGIIQKIRDESGDAWGCSEHPPLKERQALIAKLTEERDHLNDEARAVQEEIDSMIGEVL